MRSKPAKKTTNRRRRWVAAVVVAVVVLAGAGVALWKIIGTGSDTPAATQRTVQVTKQTIKDTVGASGTVEPLHQSDVSFTSSGTVTSVKVGVGDKVSKGDTLATIDKTDLKADVTAAEADYEAAQDALTTAQDDDDSTTAELNAAESKVAVDKSKVTQAKSALAAATLKSPISGTVAVVGIAKGDSVGSSGNAADTSSGTSASGSGSGSTSSSSSVITVISTGKYHVDTTVGSADIAKIKKGLQATITVSGSTQPIFGTVSSVAVMATSTSGTGTSTSSGSSATFDVGIDVTGTQKNLYAGATVTASIVVQQRPDVLTVPTAAITTVDGKTVVNKVVNGKPVQTEITIGDSFGATTEVSKGLAEGDSVVVTFAARTGAGTGTRTGGTGTGTGNRGGYGGQGGFGQSGTGTGQQPAGQPAGQPSTGTR